MKYFFYAIFFLIPQISFAQEQEDVKVLVDSKFELLVNTGFIINVGSGPLDFDTESSFRFNSSYLYRVNNGVLIGVKLEYFKMLDDSYVPIAMQIKSQLINKKNCFKLFNWTWL